MEIGVLKAALASANGVILTRHAQIEALAEQLNLKEVRASIIANGEIIEDYPNDPRGMSCLILSSLLDGRPVHSCWGYQPLLHTAVLITVYRPDLQPLKWMLDWRRRSNPRNTTS